MTKPLGTCVISNNPKGKGMLVSAFDKAGKLFAKGDDFTTLGMFGNGIFGSFIDNIPDLIGKGGKAIGSSYALEREPGMDQTYSEDGITIDLGSGTCDVTLAATPLYGQPKPVRLGITLQSPPFRVMP